MSEISVVSGKVVPNRRRTPRRPASVSRVLAGTVGSGGAATAGLLTGHWLIGLTAALVVALPGLIVYITAAVVALRKGDTTDDRVKLIEALAELIRAR